MQTRHARVTRAFYFQGKPVKVGDTGEFPAVFALEMAAAKKLELIDKPTPAAAKPEDSVKSKAEPAKAKGGKDAV